MQAVILAAGKGLRLKPFTENHPKPLIEIAGKPLLQYTLEALPDEITEIIIVIGYLGKQIKQQFGNSWNNLPITYVEQTDLLGTGDALLQAKNLLDNNFLVINGDDLYQKDDITKLLQFKWSMLAWPSEEAYQFGLSVNSENEFTGFNPSSRLTNCGAYNLTKDFFKHNLAKVTVHNKVEYSLPHTLAKVAETEPIHVIKASFWLPVGTPDQLEQAQKYFHN